jgi:hypothetical protein
VTRAVRQTAAKADVDAAWTEVTAGSSPPTTWDAAKTAFAAATPVARFFGTPTNKGTTFGDNQGHPQATDAVTRAVGEFKSTGEVEAPDKAKTDAGGYATDQKANTLHKGESLLALQGEIWDGSSTVVEAATSTMTDALVELMAGKEAGLPELPDEVRAAIWAAVQAVGVTTSTSGDKVFVKLANEGAPSGRRCCCRTSTTTRGRSGWGGT